MANRQTTLLVGQRQTYAVSLYTYAAYHGDAHNHNSRNANNLILSNYNRSNTKFRIHTNCDRILITLSSICRLSVLLSTFKSRSQQLYMSRR